MIRIFRYIILSAAVILGVISGVSVVSAVLNGQDSLQGRASVLFVNDFWTNAFGASSVFWIMIAIQFALAVTAILGPFFAIKKLKRPLVCSIVLFLVSSVLLDVMRFGEAFGFIIYMLIKYLIYASLIIFLFKTRSGGIEANS